MLPDEIIKFRTEYLKRIAVQDHLWLYLNSDTESVLVYKHFPHLKPKQ